jgi:multiple sugar transport system permease protein
MGWNRKSTYKVGVGLTFLLPNIVGVLTFVIFPVIFSIVIAFTNWDLKQHNMWRDEPLSFIGFDNFTRLFTEPHFLRFLGNTLFLMMGIPFGIAAALIAAILLSKNLRGPGGRFSVGLFAGVVLIAAIGFLAAVGLGSSAMVILLVGLACGILIVGSLGGTGLYRLLFYTPHFTAGVATFILWKKLYSPYDGPINTALRPVLQVVEAGINSLPGPLVQSGFWGCLAFSLLTLHWVLRRFRLMWKDGDLGLPSAAVGLLLVLVPTVVGCRWGCTARAAGVVLAVTLLLLVANGRIAIKKGRDFECTPMNGVGSGLVIGLMAMVVQFIFLGLGALFSRLPSMASAGLEPPLWLADYSWAKPALIIMAFWAAMGSNNMLLYLAALTNVPQELYDAADIDGANRVARFWNVVWPQLAPTTFFIIVMSIIGGLQGGFEMARTMTQGGPAGATTTLSYFVYTEGFETGRLGFAAAVSWALFFLVFMITLFNWKFGNRYVND